MTLIIRAPGRIASPLPGSFDPPNLGVTGVFARFMAVGAAPNPGDAITTLQDQVGSHDVSKTEGVATYEELGGVPVISLVAAGRNTLLAGGITGLPKGRTIALLVHLTGNPTGTEQMVSTVPGGAALPLLAGGDFAAYGDSGIYPKSAVAAKPGWFTLVASIGADGTGKIAVNGVITNGTLAYAGTGVNSQIRISAPDTIGMKFVDLAIIDHAVSDVEIASITAGLGEWLL